MGINYLTKMYKTIVILALVSIASSRIILRDQPADISDCSDSQRQNLVGFQGSWQAYPIPGKTLAITVSATATDVLDIVGAQVDTNTKGATIDTRKLDITEHVDAGGQFTMNYSYYLPGFTPKGDYNLKFSLLDKDGVSYGCAIVNLT